MASVSSPSSTPPPSPPSSPNCSKCGANDDALSKYITRSSNRNGNAGRPYTKCVPCDRFITFNDDRGNHANNIECYCGTPSRLQVAGKAKGRGLHYVCSSGACRFYDIRAKADVEGREQVAEQATVTEDLLKLMVELKIV